MMFRRKHVLLIHYEFETHRVVSESYINILKLKLTNSKVACVAGVRRGRKEKDQSGFYVRLLDEKNKENNSVLAGVPSPSQAHFDFPPFQANSKATRSICFSSKINVRFETFCKQSARLRPIFYYFLFVL